MDGYIQIGVTALRDPVTGEVLKSVPLYMREEDRRAESPAEVRMDGIIGDLALMMVEYAKALSEKEGGNDGGSDVAAGGTADQAGEPAR